MLSAGTSAGRKEIRSPAVCAEIHLWTCKHTGYHGDFSTSLPMNQCASHPSATRAAAEFLPLTNKGEKTSALLEDTDIRSVASASEGVAASSKIRQQGNGACSTYVPKGNMTQPTPTLQHNAAFAVDRTPPQRAQQPETPPSERKGKGCVQLRQDERAGHAGDGHADDIHGHLTINIQSRKSKTGSGGEGRWVAMNQN